MIFGCAASIAGVSLLEKELMLGSNGICVSFVDRGDSRDLANIYP